MQVNIIEVKTKIKNVNTYNESSLFINLQDNEPNRNSNRLNKTINMRKSTEGESELVKSYDMCIDGVEDWVIIEEIKYMSKIFNDKLREKSYTNPFGSVSIGDWEWNNELDELRKELKQQKCNLYGTKQGKM